MTRILKTSGFIGLAVMMSVGLYQNYLHVAGGTVEPWMVGGHAHLGVLSILAIVVGFAVPALSVVGRLRQSVTALFVAGQWGLPLTVWIGQGAEIMVVLPTAFLWGACLIVAMLILAWQAATTDAAANSPATSAGTPVDD
ncbi:hypothetical protein [Natronomonas amylolytica]|uniref:hypothetical protein n=1 Tax=Natronomonas amylolytica TaxID=3108498 RepID=UPI00300A67E1